MSKLTKLGQWLFRNRTYLPVAIIPALSLLRLSETEGRWVFYVGAGLIILGELIRIWGVSYAGSITRTRARRLNKLVTNGPFAYVRNPLYIGNFLLWTGFTFISEVVWLIPFIWIWFILQYNAIIRWEEKILAEEFGAEYVEYKKQVPRWFPRLTRYSVRSEHEPQFWAAIRSERGTFGVVIFMTLILVIKEIIW